MDYFKVGKLKNAESNLHSEVNFTPLLVTPHMHTNRNPMASLHIMQLASKESKIPLGYAQWNSKWMLRKIRERIDLTTSVNMGYREDAPGEQR